MPEVIINCQNLQCPEPVIRTKKVIDSEAPTLLQVIVDNNAARENIYRLLTSQGYSVASSQDGTLHTLIASCDGPLVTPLAVPAESSTANEKVAVLITSETMGSGDDMLGSKLMRSLLVSLHEFGPSLWRVILLNGGVKLTTELSPVIKELQSLEEKGTTVLVCGACLEHYGLLQNKKVGKTTNMLDIVTSMQLANKVLHI